LKKQNLGGIDLLKTRGKRRERVKKKRELKEGSFSVGDGVEQDGANRKKKYFSIGESVRTSKEGLGEGLVGGGQGRCKRTRLQLLSFGKRPPVRDGEGGRRQVANRKARCGRRFCLW